MAENLYLHFPFCRTRCSYCNLYSRAGLSVSARESYVASLAARIRSLPAPHSPIPNPQSPIPNPHSLIPTPQSRFTTVYFGGGSPALCDLRPVFEALRPSLAPDAEFTVELHPLDVTRELLDILEAGGVNRISMGLQSLDDDILAHMNRGYTFNEAERAFYLVKERFDNAGIDLIVGYPGETAALLPRHARLAKWGLRHCSAYSLQNDRKLKDVIDDETVMNRIAVTAKFLADLGLERYEISNYAAPGYECRHNLAVWRGEDYLGLGEGAAGRIGLDRTLDGKTVETVSPELDRRERSIFRLRTREGLATDGFPEWIPILEEHLKNGLLVKTGGRYRLTARGTEVCDAILADLV